MACPEEERLVALAEGVAPEADRAALMEHVEGCDACMDAIGALTRAAVTREAGTRFGRYVLGALLGSGAMGAVYRARDTELERDVAVKVVRGDRGDEPLESLRARLRDEAKHLARVQSPHVVTVHDAGVTDDGDVYLVMELVEGHTLRAWLAEAPRTAREIVAAFAAAGSGLAAAHAAGVVHRDFKPENVFVARDGRVRVGDFGLARVGQAVETVDGEAPAGGVATLLTRTRAGTPAYMAPEQRLGRVGPRSDQYALCLALAEALVGRRVGAAEVARERTIPPALRSVIARGLAEDPGARWPAIDDVVRALERHLAPRRARWIVATAALVAIGGTGIAVASTRFTDRGASCDLGGEALERAVGPARVADMQAAIDRAKLGARGANVAAAVAGAFTQFRTAWTVARQTACAAGTDAAARLTCLDLQLVRADALAELLVHADGVRAESAAGAAQQLPDPRGCAAAATLTDDQRQLPTAVALEHRLARIAATRVAGDRAVGRDLTTPVIAEAEAGHFDRVRAHALLERARNEDWAGPLDAAHRDYTAAVDLALVGHDDLTAADALVGLTYSSTHTGKFEEAALAGELARSLIRRVGGDPVRESSLEIGLCMRAWSVGRDFAAGQRTCDHALALTIASGEGETQKRFELEVEMGNLANLDGRYDDALAHYERALRGLRALYADTHPAIQSALGNEADTLVQLGRAAEARPLFQGLVETSPDAAALWDGLGIAAAGAGDFAAAAAAHRHAIELATTQLRSSDLCSAYAGLVDDLARPSSPELATLVPAARASCAEEGTPYDRARIEAAAARAATDPAIATVLRTKALSLLEGASGSGRSTRLRDELTAQRSSGE